MHSSSVKSSEAGTYQLEVVLAGAGAAAPGKTRGNGIVVTRTGVGVYRLTVAEDLGPLLSVSGPVFGDTAAPANVKGFTLTRGAYNAAGRYVEISVWNSAFAATDLAVNMTLDLTLKFKNSTAV